MSVTITLDDQLARRLKCQAEVLDLSLEEWALEVLANGRSRLEDPANWKKLNARRLALIRKEQDHSLTPQEEVELAELQSLVELVFEPMDRRRLDYLKQVQAMARNTDRDADV